MTIKEIVGLNSGTNPLTQAFAKYFQPDKKMPPEVPPQLVALAAAAVCFIFFCALFILTSMCYCLGPLCHR